MFEKLLLHLNPLIKIEKIFHDEDKPEAERIEKEKEEKETTEKGSYGADRITRWKKAHPNDDVVDKMGELLKLYKEDKFTEVTEAADDFVQRNEDLNKIEKGMDDLGL